VKESLTATTSSPKRIRPVVAIAGISKLVDRFKSGCWCILRVVIFGDSRHDYYTPVRSRASGSEPS